MNFYDCGCGGSTRRDEDEIERIVREVEKERKSKPVATPTKRTTKKDEPIPAPDVFTRKRVPVKVDR